MLRQTRGRTPVKFVLKHVNSRDMRTKFLRNLCEFRTNSPAFTPVNRLRTCRSLAPLVLGAVWAWWMLLGRDVHWMMRNEAGGRILPPQIPQKEPKIWRSPRENLKSWVDSREYSRPIQTATCPPFTKGSMRPRRADWPQNMPPSWPHVLRPVCPSWPHFLRPICPSPPHVLRLVRLSSPHVPTPLRPSIVGTALPCHSTTLALSSSLASTPSTSHST